MEFIVAYESGLYTVTELADQFGISRKTAYKLLGRYRSDGPTGLVDASRRPEHCPWATPAEVVKDIVACRRKHPRWGPKKLLRKLSKRPSAGEQWPAVSTVALILKREGLSKPRRRRTGRTEVARPPFVQPTEPNVVWTTDFKGQFRTGNGELCYPLTIMDRHSRYLLACQSLPAPTLAGTQRVFLRVFQEVGLPLYIHSDNGEPFGGVGLAGLSRLQVFWLRLGIRPEPGRPAHPQDNPEHERMHGTLKADTARPPAATGAGQQRRFRHFRHEYNWERPHEALEFRVPGEVYRPSPRPYPRTLPAVEYPGHYEIRLVSTAGQIKWDNRPLFLSVVLQQEWVGLEEVDDGVWDIHFGPVILGRFDGRTARLLGTRRLRYAA
jgi:transposase InsO family protein